MGNNLLAAYAAYLDRMYDQSNDLDVVDQFTVPKDIDIESIPLSEWCDFV